MFQSFCRTSLSRTAKHSSETNRPSSNPKLETQNQNKGLILLDSKIEHATLPEKMEDTHHHHHQQRRRRATSFMNSSGGGGEIVQVQGGHIVRATGRKDRHSKVCTAKGTRDRRVRLAAHTAIQFYDVQDRLGYDRPSKAVDWLIRKAKAAIDELEELPAWNPIARREEKDDQNVQMMDDGGGEDSGFLPASMDSDAIADTIKSFFPMGASSETDLVNRNGNQSQDLKLSLQSLQDPLLHHHHQGHHNHQPPPPQHQNSNPTPLGFDTNSGWFEQHQTPTHQRMVGWSSGGDAASTNGGGGGGYIFGSPPTPLPPAAALFGETQFFSQRGPLQSSYTPSIRAWFDPPSAATNLHHHHHFHQSAVSGGTGFTSGGGFGFRIPARIQGEEEEHDGVSDKPSSVSSDSRH